MESKQEKSLRYNEGKPQWSLVHYESIEGIVRVLEFGQRKYNRNNWMLGLDLNEIMDSNMRHTAALMDGEIYDKESGCRHSDHILCNMMFWNYHYNKQNSNKIKEEPIINYRKPEDRLGK